MKRSDGFTLVEVLVSLVLLALVGGIAVRVLLRQHWAGVAQSERGALQSSLRAGALYLASELRELGGTPGDPDLLAIAPESLTYRAMRGAGVSCDRAPASVSIDALRFSGYRSPQPGRDSILLHHEGREDTANDDRWLRLPLLSVANASCGATPSYLFGTTLDTTTFPLSRFGARAPVRTYEVMQVKLYQSGSDYWLGARSVSANETIQPLIGPLTSNGLALSFHDSAGVPATSAADVRSIGITLRALSANAIRGGAGFGPAQRRVDSVTTMVMLRNW